MILTPEGKVHALDAKVTLDENAAFRHPEWEEYADDSDVDPREKMAKEKGLNYIGLSGTVGIIANGAGLAMSTLDVVTQVGGEAANFLDIGGGANADVMAAALEVINADPAVKSILVNIFGGITRVDEVANGIIEAIGRVKLSSPIVMRLDGTNAGGGPRPPGQPPVGHAHRRAHHARGGPSRRRPGQGLGGPRPPTPDRARHREDTDNVSIFVDETTKVVIQGISPTSQGLYHGLRNKAYGTKVVGGTNPKRGGEEIEGIPVFASVAEAVKETGATASFISVPPRGAADAIIEAAEAGIAFIVCITEGIPAQDEAVAYNRLVEEFPGTRLLGPNCPGIISPGKCNIGITSGDIALAGGPVGIVSRSGTLTYQALHELSQQGIGQTTCVGIGGDPVPGTNFIDCLAAFEADPDTKAVMMIGEIGGSEEERAAEFIADQHDQAGGGLHRRRHGPPGTEDGPRRRHHLGLPGHGPGQDGGPLGGRGCRGAEPDGVRREDGRDRPGSRLSPRGDRYPGSDIPDAAPAPR